MTEKIYELEQERLKIMEQYQNDVLAQEENPTPGQLDAINNHHILELKEIDIQRKEKRADFHIKQRDTYIDHLKKQL